VRGPSLTIAPHPRLDAVVFDASFPRPLGEVDASTLGRWLALDAPAPLRSDDGVRQAVRELLRHGGYKPTGRGKPASEYLLRAVGEGALGSINAVVDACNVVSLHSGLPISVVDLDRATGGHRIAIAEEGVSYVFNASGQTIDLGGLVCLFDDDGPSANAVKDAQRTKTSPSTTRTRAVIWGSLMLPGRAEAAFAWYASLLGELGATVERVEPASTNG
jgi:DNA/RNA-binding domain of Phe-tRNA-synthetase-like protein